MYSTSVVGAYSLVYKISCCFPIKVGYPRGSPQSRHTKVPNHPYVLYLALHETMPT